jgi:hypothetical protein
VIVLVEGSNDMNIRYLFAVLAGLFVANACGMEVAAAWNKRRVRIYNRTTEPIEVRTRQQFSVPDQATGAPSISDWETLPSAQSVRLKYLFEYVDTISGLREHLDLTVAARPKNGAEEVASVSFTPHKEPGYDNSVVVTIANGKFALQAHGLEDNEE